jgi:hypothetical protein
MAVAQSACRWSCGSRDATLAPALMRCAAHRRRHAADRLDQIMAPEASIKRKVLPPPMKIAGPARLRERAAFGVVHSIDAVT